MLVATLAALVPLWQGDALLHPAPAGWLPERPTVAPSFAPELEYRGIEELAFAPGMFTLESDSYFSYALAWRVEGEIEVDEAMLTRFLETYYRGLCREVAKERKLERD